MNFQMEPSYSACDIPARQRQPEIVDSLGRYDDVDFHRMCRDIWVHVDWKVNEEVRNVVRKKSLNAN